MHGFDLSGGDEELRRLMLLLCSIQIPFPSDEYHYSDLLYYEQSSRHPDTEHEQRTSFPDKLPRELYLKAAREKRRPSLSVLQRSGGELFQIYNKMGYITSCRKDLKTILRPV